jgi:ribosome biogenesis GTPase A
VGKLHQAPRQRAKHTYWKACSVNRNAEPGSDITPPPQGIQTEHGTEQSVTVGVFGFPNIRKSSLINLLKRTKVSRCVSLGRVYYIFHF